MLIHYVNEVLQPDLVVVVVVEKVQDPTERLVGNMRISKYGNMRVYLRIYVNIGQ